MGERLKQAREAAGLSQFALAVKVGTTPQTISNYERGARPRGDLLLRMARVLKVQPEDLMPPVGAAVPAASQ